MGLPVTIPVVNDLAIAAVRTNIMAGIPQRVVNVPSVVDIALTREGVDVTVSVEIGGTVAIPGGSPVAVDTVLGSLPRFDVAGVGRFGAEAGDEIAIFGSNANAAAQELRAQVRITALDDLAIMGDQPR